jgi:hypothetical protein
MRHFGAWDIRGGTGEKMPQLIICSGQFGTFFGRWDMPGGRKKLIETLASAGWRVAKQNVAGLVAKCCMGIEERDRELSRWAPRSAALRADAGAD